MEASALQAPVRLGRISLTAPLLRLRSDEQLVALFRSGSEEAFRVIFDRYRPRIFAYTRQMLAGSRADAEDALQDVFIRAYGSLRNGDRPIALRPWLYRVAHNRCVDQLRRPVPVTVELWEGSGAPLDDPMVEAERREDLRRLVADVRRLPEQQRSVLLMRELEGLSYEDLAAAHETSVAAIKSLLVRARVGLVQAAEARNVDCIEVRDDLALAYGRGVRANGRARRHLRDCTGCREYRTALRGVERSLGALAPAGLASFGLVAKLTSLFGGSSGSAGAGGAGATAAGAAGGAAGTGATAAVGGTTLLGGSTAALGAAKVAAVVASVVLTGGAAVTVEQKIAEHYAAPAAISAPASETIAPLPAAATVSPPIISEPDVTSTQSAPADTAGTTAADAAAPVTAATPDSVLDDNAAPSDPTLEGDAAETTGGVSAPVDPSPTGEPGASNSSDMTITPPADANAPALPKATVPAGSGSAPSGTPSANH